jgi:hypothetical protein
MLVERRLESILKMAKGDRERELRAFGLEIGCSLTGTNNGPAGDDEGELLKRIRATAKQRRSNAKFQMGRTN